MSTDLFGTKPRKKREWLMHVTDAGTDGMNHEDDNSDIIEFTCKRCKHCTGWIKMDMTVTAAKRGIPCPECNKP